MALVKADWWTKAQAATDAQGEGRVRAFYGTHRITIELPGGQILSRDVQWQRGQQNRFDFTA